ncbi:GNAT family N-acetyltransferase [Enterococcus sp. LJL51]|uniref:GNAT family N-acetyltransferase n=1 Tax=Enterococcus sp. LJL51 TaxID=3416656 RepID=UPI003CF89DB6
MQFRNYIAEQDREWLIQLCGRFADFPLPQRIEHAGFRKQQMDWMVLDLEKAEQVHLLIAVLDGQRAGFIEMKAEEDWLTGEKQAYVSRICTTEDMEGKGVGKALMTQAERWAAEQGFEGISLNVFAGNTHAAAFYESLGYEKETIKMRKTLN